MSGSSDILVYVTCIKKGAINYKLKSRYALIIIESIKQSQKEKLYGKI